MPKLLPNESQLPFAWGLSPPTRPQTSVETLGLQTPEWAVLDARESIEELEGKIREIALTTVAAVEDTDFQKLQ